MPTVKKDLWDANLYDQNHTFVSKYGQNLIELLAPQPDEVILDLGCGTGDLANKLFEHGTKVLGVDLSENMVAQATQKYPHITFQTMDATALPFDEEFDAVFSNATLHWIKTPTLVLEGIFRSLKQGGRFVAEFGGKGNVGQITDELISQLRLAGVDFKDDQFPWYFPSIGEYTALMESVGFHVELAQHYERPTKLEGENGLRNWIEMFSPSLFEQISHKTKEQIIQSTLHNLKATLYYENNWHADYKRLRIVAKK